MQNLLNNPYNSLICHYNDDINNNLIGGDVETKKRYVVSFKANLK